MLGLRRARMRAPSGGTLVLPFELQMLGYSVLLGLVHILLAAHAASMQRGYRWAAGSRDEPLPALTGIAGRLTRAQSNFLETFAFFATLAIAVVVSGRSGPLSIWGAGLYLSGRIVYLPLYAAGIPYVRSLAWNVAAIGILLLLVALLRG